MGHEYCGIVEEVGGAVGTIKLGQFVIGSFLASDNTGPHCRAGYQSSCQHREVVGTAQAPLQRLPLADGMKFLRENICFALKEIAKAASLREQPAAKRIDGRLTRRTEQTCRRTPGSGIGAVEDRPSKLVALSRSCHLPDRPMIGR